MENTGEIVGGLNIKDVVEGGANFEMKYNEDQNEGKDEEEKISAALQSYLKLECVDAGVSYNGTEPFSSIGKEMQNILQSGKIKKKIIREGYGSKPEQGTIVHIHFNAYVQYEALPFDSTYARNKPFTFPVGEGNVIEGLDIAVLSMKLNEKSQFLIDPELAYRSGGLDRIPPNSVVLFEIELCNVQELAKATTSETNERDFSVVYPSCVALNIQGKKCVKLKDYQSAIKAYSTAVDKLERAILSDYSEQEKSEGLLVRLYINLLICHTQIESPKRGCIYAQQIYYMAKNGTIQVPAKVYFNHAKCLRILGGYDRAHRILAQAAQLEPANTGIQKEFQLLKEAREKDKARQRNMGKALLRS